jgi:hypothetical protein
MKQYMTQSAEILEATPTGLKLSRLTNRSCEIYSRQISGLAVESHAAAMIVYALDPASRARPAMRPRAVWTGPDADDYRIYTFRVCGSAG